MNIEQVNYMLTRAIIQFHDDEIESLSEATVDSGLLVESMGEPDEDISKSLNSLIKYNKGEWKSDKQARFFFMRYRDLKKRYFDKDKLLAWARKYGYENKLLIPTVHFIKEFGRSRSPEKQRYWGQIFVLDGGGIIARFKMKGMSGGKGHGGMYAINWSKPGKVTFERKGEPPKIYFDFDQAEAEERKRKKELERKVKENQGTINLIKTIPDWEDRDILGDFIDQLERGRTLSMSQLAIVRDMLPGKNLEIGDKKEWIKSYDEFKALVADKIVAPWIDIHRGAQEKEYENFEKLAVAKSWQEKEALFPGSSFGMASKPDIEKSVAPVTKLLADIKSKGYGSDDWIENWVFDMLVRDIVYAEGERMPLYRSADSFQGIYDQYRRAIKAKKPTKKAIRVITFIMKAVKVLKKVSENFIRRKIVLSHYSDFPELITEKPSQGSKKSIGYKIPPPSKFNF